MATYRGRVEVCDATGLIRETARALLWSQVSPTGQVRWEGTLTALGQTFSLWLFDAQTRGEPIRIRIPGGRSAPVLLQNMQNGQHAQVLGLGGKPAPFDER
jgi:hypothetical protein